MEKLRYLNVAHIAALYKNKNDYIYKISTHFSNS